MYQLELVFRLLVRLQFMYFQYNVYLRIVVRTNIVYIIYIYIYMHMIQTILGHPSWWASPHQLGCKKISTTKLELVFANYLYAFALFKCT